VRANGSRDHGARNDEASFGEESAQLIHCAANPCFGSVFVGALGRCDFLQILPFKKPEDNGAMILFA